jgi:hypothetical protein
VLSRWISADPFFDKYLPLSSEDTKGRRLLNGGIYNPYNLSMYVYTYNNPIKYIDPDGLWGAQIHGKETLNVLIGMGYHEQVAIEIAKYNIAVDTGNPALVKVKEVDGDIEFYVGFWGSIISFFTPQAWKSFFDDPAHATAGKVEEAGDKVMSLKNMAIKLAIAGEIFEARRLLGEALHTLQDIHAHQGIGKLKHIIYSIIEALTFGLVKLNPDNPSIQPERIEKVRKDTKKLLEDFESAIGPERAKEIKTKINESNNNKKD